MYVNTNLLQKQMSGNTYININYSSNIEYYRELKGMTKKELFEKAGISRSSFNDMMARNTFSTTYLEKIAFALGIQVVDLVKERDKDELTEKLEDFKKIEETLQEYKNKHLK